MRFKKSELDRDINCKTQAAKDMRERRAEQRWREELHAAELAGRQERERQRDQQMGDRNNEQPSPRPDASNG